VLLQARPITAADEAPPPGLARLTRANIGEVLPDPVTPLTFSTIGGFLEHAFRTVLARAGLLAPDAPPMVVRHLERLYLNLTLALDVAARMPLVSAADAERLILGAGATAGAAPPRPRLAGLGTAVRLMALGATKARLVRESERLVLSLPSAERTLAANAASLVAQLDQWLEVGRQVATTHILASGASGATLSLLRRLVAWLAPGDSAARVARLTAGLQGVASAAPTIALEELAARASEREDWQAWIQSGRELESAPHLLRLELRAFLDQYGHRALGEGELSAAAWEDDPSPVLEALRGLLAGAGRSRRARSTQVETRRAEEEALLSRRSPLVFAILRGALSSAHAGVREREHTKSLSVKVAGHGRRLARAAARRLVEAGHLAREADVFFLEWPELRQALDAGVAPGHGLLARRKRRHAREGSLPAPREVDLGRGRPLEEGGAVVSGATVQQGIGVSPGTGRGRVRILRPGQPPRLEPGEVLVAPVLDAALGPLLASAAAAVAEMGGVLSHGSVVARELGVPCVVDVRQALETLKDGELVEVDGDRGEVRRVGQGELALALEGATADNDDGSSLVAEDTTRELFSSGLPSGQRESVYFNIGDSTSGLKIIATVGVRAGGRGESVLALSLPDGRILFGLDRAPAATTSRTLRVAGAHVETGPVRLHWQTRLSVHEGSAFPPAPTPLLLAPRTAAVELELTLHPSGPAIDFCRQLTPARREALRSMGDHHVEQSGRFVGRVKVLEREIQVDAEGSRDHSWGPRDWAALDYSRLFVARFGDDLALQALTLAVRGEVVDGGFLWRGGRAERVARILYSVEREQGAPRSFEVEVRTAGGEGFWMRGLVERTLVVPVQLERRAWRHLVGRPYSLLLQENFVRWEAGTRSGLGVAEFSVRP
jgi:phosphohistidine swiveling domain-containing protein